MGAWSGTWRRLAWPLRIVVGALLLGLVVIGIQTVGGDASYHARLRHAAGIKAGDDVRVAGLKVGRVTAVEAERDQVDVAFVLDQAPEELGITADSPVEVKILSILGQRFLSLTPGRGEILADGATIGVEHARDSYTIERFWLEATPQVQALDLEKIQGAVDVLATDLAIAPEQLRDALDGIAGVSAIANDREQQIDSLLAATRKVTDLVISQTDEIDEVMANGTLVMVMVQQRRETLRSLLVNAERFVTGLTGLVRTTAPQLKPALRDMRAVLDTLVEHKADLEETMRLAGPTMRVFTNATGDGPWLGVNAPWAIFPDDLFCSITPEKCR
jgi:phospholipid/cholesterol/gamma-HCH transport system substrate-binding protein